MMEKYDSRVDTYIDKSADFAKPILTYIRQVVHEASPLLSETIKWSFPFFDYKGPVCQMAAFKQHAAFGFWRVSRLNDPGRFLSSDGEAAAGSFGRIHSIADLPREHILKEFILQAIALNESGIKAQTKKSPVEKVPVVIPDYFIEALAVQPKTLEVFEKFSPAQQREYATWLLEAKTDATRDKRLQTAVEWISEGKIRNWKYE